MLIMTKKEMFAEIINLAIANDRVDIVDFANKEIGLIEKRANVETQAQKARKEERRILKNQIANFFVENPHKEFQASYIAEALKLSTQKIVPILKELTTEDTVVRFEIKRKAYYVLNPDKDLDDIEGIEEEEEEEE